MKVHPCQANRVEVDSIEFLSAFNSEDRKIFKDSIQSGKTEGINFWEAVKNLCYSLWIYFKNSFLFCFFDVEEEQRNRLKVELKLFYDNIYFANAHDTNNNSKEKYIAQKYKKLSKDLRKIIEEEIKKLIWEKLPKTRKASSGNMQQVVKDVIENPFRTLQIGKDPSNTDPLILPDAMFNAELRLSGVSDEDDG